MVEAAEKSALALNVIDAASLHPALTNSSTNYYKECFVARAELKEILTAELDIAHDLYVLTNTTHGFLTAALGLQFDGFELSARPNSYAPYRSIRPELYRPGSGHPISLFTHINPHTGEVGQLSEVRGKPIVSDVAQSFATAGFHRQALAGDVFICPLHKHVGLARGLGLLAISRTADLPNLKMIARLAEAGTTDLDVLSQAIARALQLSGRLVNQFVLRLRICHRDALQQVGIRILSPLEQPLPFSVFAGIDPDRLSTAIVSTPFSFKSINLDGHIRISGAVRGSLAARSEDYADQLTSLLEGACVSGGKT